VYTNAAGRAVSAPRPARPAALPALTNGDAPQAVASSSRKRARSDNESVEDARPAPAPAPAELPPVESVVCADADEAPLLQPLLVHELVNRAPIVVPARGPC
jgi:hypothetical protein